MKILIADDHDLFSDALKVLINKSQPEAFINCVCDYEAAQKAINDAQENSQENYDVAILDLNMPGMKGANSIKTFCKNFPKTPVILISGMASKAEIEESLAFGAKGFIPKTMAGNSVVNAISIVINGDKFIHPSLYEKDNSKKLGKTELTPREGDVLEKLFLGDSNKEIAASLGISEVTVKLHISSLFDKFSAKNRTDLIIKATKQGFGD